MTQLKDKHCIPCEGGVPTLNEAEIKQLLSNLDQWMLSEDQKYIYRDYKFKGFYKTMAFINAMAWIVNNEGHHPDFEAGYNHCLVKFTTHAIDGLSENDFICASKLNQLL
ncbi:MAG: 4a-hydroxytetrahydrobiopterin dehydratase [bacterium]